MEVRFSEDRRLSGCRLALLMLEDPRVSPTSFAFERLEKKVFSSVRARHTTQSLREHALLASFRKLFWQFDMDPTKVRVSSEALLRRVLGDENLWRVNSAVDAVNLVSVETGLPISLWDAERVRLPIEVRAARKGEVFHQRGDGRIACQGTELVVSDAEKILTLGFASTDSELSAVTADTENAIVAVYGTSAVSHEELHKAVQRIKELLEQHTRGSVTILGVFPGPSEGAR